MKKLILAAAGAALAFASAAAAQSAQEQLDTRYERALAAGYKALMLCSAIANAERAGATRTPESVEKWELTGIQAPLDGIVGELPYEITTLAENNPGIGVQVRMVSVRWASDMPPRFARHDSAKGCQLYPVDSTMPPFSSVHGRQLRASVPVTPFAPGLLSNAATAAFSAAYGEGTRTTAIHISETGQILGERYAGEFDANTPQRTWSVAKSIAATLVGMAVHRGEADANASAGLGADASDPRRAITVDHLLRMASGRYSDTPGNRTDALYFGGGTVEETAAHWPLIHAPGSVFRYANNDTLMAVKAISPTFAEHPPGEFFAKLWMHDTVAETDWKGDYVLSSQVWSTARDLALFGQLYLDDGVLPNGERVLPQGWRDYVSTPSGPQPAGPFGYGAGFWLMNRSEGVPPDTFAAFGNRGQYVVIVPSRNVVIVRRGEDPVGTRFDIAAFTRDVLAALD